MSITRLATVTTYGPAAGSARVRVFDWLAHLGIDADVTAYLGQEDNKPATLARRPVGLVRAERSLRRLTRTVSDRSVLLSRQASPFSNGAIERRILRSAARGVYDVDDALSRAPLGGLERIWSKRRVWAAAVSSADVVIAGNEHLAQLAEDSGARRVVIIPSCVEPDHYSVKRDYEVDDVPRLAWIGSPSTESYLRDIAVPLLAVHERTGTRLTLISAGSQPLGRLDRMVDRVDWAQGGIDRLASADIGIMPLRDDEWSRGKCAYKLLQYAATGLPMIGSPVGANARALHRFDGLSATDEDSWQDALHALLIESTARRRKRGERARQGVQADDSYAAFSALWRTTVLP